MSKYDQLREMRERQWKAGKSKPVTKIADVTKVMADVTKVGKLGRPRVGDHAMTSAERKRRQRAHDPA
jgi:hypothetical protein